jgi:hypothetical protein
LEDGFYQHLEIPENLITPFTLTCPGPGSVQAPEVGKKQRTGSGFRRNGISGFWKKLFFYIYKDVDRSSGKTEKDKGGFLRKVRVHCYLLEKT